MKHLVRSLAVAAVASVAVFPAVPASAWPLHHVDRAYRRGHAPAAYSYSAYGYARPGYETPGAIIAEATARAQHEPGLTRELAPDSRQTATGGPVGGVPGFSGGN